MAYMNLFFDIYVDAYIHKINNRNIETTPQDFDLVL